MSVRQGVRYVKPDGSLTVEGVLALGGGGATGDFATAAQGALADSALQPGDPIAWADVTGAPAGFSGVYGDLVGVPVAFPPTAHSHSAATTSADGFMSATDKTKIDGIAAGAQVNVGTDLTYTASSRLLASSTGADVTLPLVASADAGLAPASGGGTTNFLRADGSWAAPATIYYGHLQADYTLTSATAAQRLFNWSASGALTLPTGVYRFWSMIYLTTMSATSGNGSFQLLGAGTATLARVLYDVVGIDSTTPLNAAAKAGSASVTQNSVASMVTAGTGTGMVASVRGYFDVTAAGTIIPSIALVTAAAAIVKAGSFFECERVGATAAAASAGWS